MNLFRLSSYCFALTLSFIAFTVNAQPNITPAPPSLSATAYILIDATTGEVLVEHNADKPVPPASLTKMMTSYVLSSQLSQGAVGHEDLVTISENAWAQNPVFAGSSLMWIEVGKQVLLSDLHRGVVISSGNDASVAIAEYVGGSEFGFVDMMNQQAKALGMNNTYFTNPHGLDSEGQVSTARDLALLARAIINDYPKDYAMYAEREFTYNHIRQANRNNLLWRDSSVDGLKTGHTSEAGYCLVASSKKQNTRLISVVLGTASSGAREAESQKLFAYGYRFFETRKIYQANTQLAELKVWGGQEDLIQLGLKEDVYITIPRGSYSKLDAKTALDSHLLAPVEKGQAHGELIVSLDDKVLLSAPLLALTNIEEAGFVKRLWHKIVLFFEKLLS